MRHRPVPSALNARVYRHFAAVTVCITVCIAVFADGENRDFVAEQVAAQRAHARPAASAPSDRRTRVNGFFIRDGNRLHGTWGSVAAVTDNQIRGPIWEDDPGSAGTSPPPLPPGFIDGRPAAEVEAEEAAAAAAGLGCGQTGASTFGAQRRCRPRPAAPTPEEIAQAKEMSRERSGSSSSDDD